MLAKLESGIPSDRQSRILKVTVRVEIAYLGLYALKPRPAIHERSANMSYEVGSVNTQCATGTYIDNEQECCVTAANQLSLTPNSILCPTDGSTASNLNTDEYFKGCYTKISNNQVFFNTHATGHE